MVELTYVDRLPIHEVVAGEAVLPEPSLMLVGVAGEAGCRESQISPVQIFNLNGRAFRGGDVRGIVAPIACQPRVLPLEQVSSILVIECLCVPFDQGKVFTVVLGMAAGALVTGAGKNVIGGVQPAVSRNPGSDFAVTIQAFQGSLPAKLMAARAIRRAVKRLVRTGERPGRDLS